MAESDPRPPNFLFLITDQHRPDHTGFGGGRVVRTPALDSLAATGCVFDRAYVANPICMPNRASMLTGRMPSAHGTRENGIPLSWDAETFVRVLAERGYRTAHVGKSHLQNMGVGRGLAERVYDPTPAAARRDAGWPAGWDQVELRERFTTSEPVAMPDDFYGYQHVDLAVGHADSCSGHYWQWLLEQGVDPTQVQGFQHAPERYDGWFQVYQPALPVDLYPTSYVNMRAVEQLEAAASDGRPFFLHCSWPDPHHPFSPPGDYWKRYDPREVELPSTFWDEHERSMPHYQRMVAERGTPQFPVDGWSPTEEQFRHAAAAEYGMIDLIDEGVAGILATLERLGLADDTVVVFTSDHGDMFGDHGILLKHAMHYEGCIRVPLVIRAPGRTPGRTSALAGSIDLAQTLLELAGAPAFHDMQGRSLVPVLDDPKAAVRDHVLIEEDEPRDAIGAGHLLRMRTVQTETARLTVYRGHAHGELFDLANDPDERVNLFGRPEARDLQQEMTARLLQALLDVADETPRPTYMA